MGHRPIPTGPVHDYTNNIGPEPDDDGPAYLTVSLPKFIEKMRGQYVDWEDFEEWLSLKEALKGKPPSRDNNIAFW